MAHEEITFTCTAMPRPEIIFKTFQSFKNNLEDIDISKCKLFINIDPYPLEDSEIRRQEVLSISRSFFNSVEYRMPKKGNFSLALKWVWSHNFLTKYVFHLEDDWVLNIPISIQEIKLRFIQDVHQVCLRAYDKQSRTKYKYKISLSPSLILSRFCTDMSKILVADQNPEEYIRQYCDENKYLGYSHDTVNVVPAMVILKDIGREWMEQKGLQRDGYTQFVNWSIMETNFYE